VIKKSRNPFLTCFICQKINYIEIRKQKKNNVILSVGNVHHIQQSMHSLFSSCLMQLNGFCLAHFPCHGNSSPDEILLICLAQEIWEMYPWTNSGNLSKNEMPGNVWHWTLIALVKKTSLHFECLKKTDRLALAGYNMMWSMWILV
jgi:hypothetical protein